MAIIAAIPEHHSGPGWTNQTIMIVHNTGGHITTEWIQMPEMTAEMVSLFDVCATASRAMITAVRKAGYRADECARIGNNQQPEPCKEYGGGLRK